MANENHADFTPTIPDSQVTPTKAPYVPVGSFKFWAQKVLPNVYDDSLSYYEVLTKLVWHINKMIEDMDNFKQTIDSTLEAYGDTQDYVNNIKDTMIATYNQLQDYVNHYFDNLDVQEEINNKLDRMASNGQLAVLFEPYIPNLVTNWLNENVNPVGSAVVVDSTLSISGAAADAAKTGEIKSKTDFIGSEIGISNLTYVRTGTGYIDDAGEVHYSDISSSYNCMMLIDSPNAIANIKHINAYLGNNGYKYGIAFMNAEGNHYTGYGAFDQIVEAPANISVDVPEGTGRIYIFNRSEQLETPVITFLTSTGLSESAKYELKLLTAYDYSGDTTKSTGIIIGGGTLDTTATEYWTSDYIPVYRNDIVMCYNSRFIAYYDQTKTYVSRYPSGSAAKYNDHLRLKVPDNGFIRVSFSKEKFANHIVHITINEEEKNYGKKYWASDYDRTIGATFTKGYWNQGIDQTTDEYRFVCIPVKAGVSYTAYPRTRFLQLYTENFVFIGAVDGQNSQVPVTFIPEQNGYAYITFRTTEVNEGTVSVYEGNNLKSAGHGKYILNDVFMPDPASTIEDTLISVLNGKKIAQFGDSIMQAGAANPAYGPGVLIANKYNLTCYDYAVGGATMGYLAEHSQIKSQIETAINDNIEPDIILFNGGTNDMNGTEPVCPLGDITDVYTEPTQSDNFSNGFESASYLLKNNFPNAMIIYIRAHNMSSRLYDRQISYGERGIDICDKWGFGVIDMYKRMNTQLSYYQTTYLADSTHPNALGYNHYYVPAIEQYLYERRNELE